MITRKDLKEYSQQEIYDYLREIIKQGCNIIKYEYLTYNNMTLMEMLIKEDPDRLMQIIRGYARYGKK